MSSFLISVSWITHCRGNQLPFCDDTEAVLLKGSHGEELRLPVNSSEESRPLANSYESETFCKQILQPQTSLRMTAALTQTLTETSGETLSHNHPVPELLTHRLWDNICLLFKLLSDLLCNSR